jgi:hypothetical protein
MRPNTHALNVGDVVVMQGAMGGPAMRVTGFAYVSQGTCNGGTAHLESLRRDDKDATRPAWLAEFLVDGLRVLPGGHYATKSPFYDFGGV